MPDKAERAALQTRNSASQPAVPPFFGLARPRSSAVSGSVLAVVLVAALPSASNSALLAERFGADSARITRVILLSTALAFPSFSAWVAWYKA